MRKIFLMFILSFFNSTFAGTVIIQYGDDVVIDCEMSHWESGGGGYFCYGDNTWSEITYFNSNRRWERYYYKIPIPIICTEAPAESVVLKIYKKNVYSPYSNQDVTFSVNKLIENLDSTFESLYGRYQAPLHNLLNIDTSLTLDSKYEGWINFDITELFNDWAFKKQENLGLVVKMLNENSATQQRIFVCQSLYHDKSKWPKIELFAPFLPDTLITSEGQATDVSRNYIDIPEKFRLSNFPNPFNSSTTIHYEIPFNCEVNVYIFNLNGHTVRKFEQGIQTAGLYSIIWDGTNSKGIQITSGTYIYAIRTASYSISNKMLLIK